MTRARPLPGNGFHQTSDGLECGEQSVGSLHCVMERSLFAAKAGAAARVIHPRKIALRLKPLCLILLYDDGRRMRKRAMPLRSLRPSVDPRVKAEELKLRHLACTETIPTAVVAKLIAIAQEVRAGCSLEEAVKKVGTRYSVDNERDLNAVTETELKLQKELMEISFLRNAIRPEDSEFVYDKQVIFDKPKASSTWDDDD